MIEMHQTTTKWFSRSGFHEVVFTKWFSRSGFAWFDALHFGKAEL